MNALVNPALPLAIVIATLFAFVAYRLRMLTISGAISTCLMGSVIYGLGNAKFMAPLLAFFLSSSLLSKWRKEKKLLLTGNHDAKGEQRDAAQVWANGGAAFCCVVAFYLATHPVSRLPLLTLRLLLMLYLSALATVNADTWATEIGKLSKKPPRLLTTWRAVTPGMSGAVSGMGMAGAFLGALFIPLVALPIWKLNPAEILVITWAGFMGSLLDSVFGATLQAHYRDVKTGELTERTQIQGRELKQVRGIRGVSNDLVNFAASLCGVLVAWIMLRYGIYRYY